MTKPSSLDTTTLTSKRCSRCKEAKPTTEFNRNRSAPTGLAQYCKPCMGESRRKYRLKNPEAHRERVRVWRKANPEKAKAGHTAWKRANPDKVKLYSKHSHIRSKYGLEPVDLEEMLKSQDGRCAICLTDAPGSKNGWHIDHDHRHGHVRAMLCHGCNLGLGGFKDIPALLRRAANYLEQHGSA